MNESTLRAIYGLAAAIGIGAAATAIVYVAGEREAYVARVNGTTIHSREYDKLYEQTKKQYATQYNIDFASEQGKKVEGEMRKTIVGQLVDRQLIRNEATNRHVEVTDAQLVTKLTEIKKGFPDEAAFAKALTSNKLTLPELKERVRDGLTTEEVIKDVTKGDNVPQAKVRAYYDQNAANYKRPEEVKASHILVKEQGEAIKILYKLRAGQDFGTLARENSLDPGSKVMGGDLGFFGRGKMVPAFEKAAFELKPGELSAPIQTQFGFHILKGGEHKPAHTQPFAEVEKEITERLNKDHQREAFDKWLKAQKSVAKIDYKAAFDPAPSPPAATPMVAPTAAASPAPAGQSVKDHAPATPTVAPSAAASPTVVATPSPRHS